MAAACFLRWAVVSALALLVPAAGASPEEETPKPVFQQGHVGLLRAAAFSPDGRTLATSGNDGTIRLWDAASGDLRVRIDVPRFADVTSIAYSPDGRYLAVGANSAEASLGSALLVDARTGVAVRSLAGFGHRWTDTVRSVCVSPDGRWVAAACEDRNLRVWDAATGDSAWSVELGRGALSCALFADAGRTLVATCIDGSVHFVDTATHRETRTVQACSGCAWAALSPDGRWLAVTGSWYAGGERKQSTSGVVVLEVASGKPVMQVEKGNPTILHATFSPDGRLLAAGAADGTIGIYSTANWRPVRTLERAWGPVAFSPDSRTLVAVGGTPRPPLYQRALSWWDVKTGDIRQQARPRCTPIHTLAFSPDGRMVAAGDMDGTVRLWDLARAALAGSVDCGGPVSSVVFSPDGRALAAGRYGETKGEGVVTLWDVKTHDRTATLQTGLNDARSVAFSPDGGTIAVAANGKTDEWPPHTICELSWWSRSGERLAMSAREMDLAYMSVAFAPDGFRVAAGCYQQRYTWSPPGDTSAEVLLYTVQDHKCAVRMQTETGNWATGVAFSPDGMMLACGHGLYTGTRNGADGSLWEYWTGRLLRTLPWDLHGLQQVAFTPDGKVLAGVGADGSGCTVDPMKGQVLQRIAVQAGRNGATAVSPDGRLLATAGEDGSARLWELATGKLLATAVALRGSADEPVPDPYWLVLGDDGFYNSSSEAADSFLRWRVGDRLLPGTAFTAARRKPEKVAAALLPAKGR